MGGVRPERNTGHVGDRRLDTLDSETLQNLEVGLLCEGSALDDRERQKEGGPGPGGVSVTFPRPVESQHDVLAFLWRSG